MQASRARMSLAAATVATTMVVVAALGASPASASARAPTSATATVYRVEQDVTLAEGQDGRWNVACHDGDLAVDGTWRVDAIANAPGDILPPDLVSGLDVLGAEPFAPGGYAFTLRNRAAGDARVHLGVQCLQGSLRGDGGQRYALRISPLMDQVTSTGEAGSLISAPLICPSGAIAVAPGYSTTGGPARIVSRFPMRNRMSVLDRSFDTLAATSIRCLSVRSTDGGPALHVTLRTGQALLPAGRVPEATISCAPGERALVGLMRLDGAWSLGGSLLGATRTFKLQTVSPIVAGSAQVGALCLRLRA